MEQEKDTSVTVPQTKRPRGRKRAGISLKEDAAPDVKASDAVTDTALPASESSAGTLAEPEKRVRRARKPKAESEASAAEGTAAVPADVSAGQPAGEPAEPEKRVRRGRKPKTESEASAADGSAAPEETSAAADKTDETSNAHVQTDAAAVGVSDLGAEHKIGETSAEIPAVPKKKRRRRGGKGRRKGKAAAPQSDAAETTAGTPLSPKIPPSITPVIDPWGADVLDFSLSFLQPVPKKDIPELPLLEYGGEVVLIRSEEEFESCVSDLTDAPGVIGFDTETKPIFVRGVSQPPSLIQLATPRRAYLLQLNRMEIPDALIEIFESPDIIKCGVGILEDMRGLMKMKPFEPAGLADLGNMAVARGLEARGLRTITASLLGYKISKKMQCSDWSRTILLQKQILYAATDAWLGLLLYYALLPFGRHDPAAV